MSAKFNNLEDLKSKIVYSTNPDFDDWDDEEEEIETPAPEKQLLYVSLDKKQRKGKKVTLVTGFEGNEQDLKDLGKTLKSKCGVGGSVKNMEIIIQGDFRNKVKDILMAMKYKCKLKG